MIPESYSYELSPSAFINHVGKLYQKRLINKQGVREVWSALEVQDHHVNTWGLCHGAVMSVLAEIGTSSVAWEPEGAPVVAIEMGMQFIQAPKLGDVIEVCGVEIKRTRSLVFTSATGFVNDDIVFTASSVQKILKK